MQQPIYGSPVKENMNTLIKQAGRLLDFSEKLDIILLDNTVNCMYTGEGTQQQTAQGILTILKEHPDAWTRVDTILEFSKNQQTKYYGLQILENVIKTRWKALPRNQCEGIKKYVVGLIIKTSSDGESSEKEKIYLNKLNVILVQILKREWPKNWPSFINDIVGASRTNESLCRNNMTILKLLSEEIFDFATRQMTQAKAKHLKDTLFNELAKIFQLCQFVMENSPNAPLVHATLETLLKFVNWMPSAYIFDTKLISTLIYKFLNVPLFRNVTLKCLTKIARIKPSPCHNEMRILLFTQTMNQLKQMLPPATNIKTAYANGSDDEQKFVQNMSLFLFVFLENHKRLIKNGAQLDDALLSAFHYLLLISEVEEIEIFKICLESAYILAFELYQETFPCSSILKNSAIVSPGERSAVPANYEVYVPVLSKLRSVLISRMAKPEEVLVVENEQGEIVREFTKDTNAMQLYKSMRETLVYLTHLDYADTEKIMTEKLNNQLNGKEWSSKNLSTLCWAIGSISGAMNEADERRFITTIINNLFILGEQKRNQDDRAIIFSNLMYVCGQYPRFLQTIRAFLKSVVHKLFEFMHINHDGVKDMACDTFIKIAQMCPLSFVKVHLNEVVSFIEEILNTMNNIICDLQPQQVHTIYEAVGYIIRAEEDANMRERLIEKYMSLPNQVWDGIIHQATQSIEILKDPDIVRQLGDTLKTNVRACKSLGHSYVMQLKRIYLDMLSAYKVMSENISAAIALNGESVTKIPLIRSMRIVKKETLKLLSSWISQSTDRQIILDIFIQPLLDVVLLDYMRCTVPSAREPEVLSTITTIINRLKDSITPEIPKFFDTVFECTVDMINKDFQEFPEYRTNFFLLLKATVTHCFPALLNIPAAQFKLIVDSIIWAFKHIVRNISDTGLSTLYRLLKNISDKGAITQSFYQTYYTDIMQQLFSVATDTSHTTNLITKAKILAYMFNIVESGEITVPLSPGEQTAGQSNMIYVQEFVARLLKSAFIHLTDSQIKITVQGFFNLDQDRHAFLQHLRDFLAQIREFAGVDDSDLFLEEREATLRAAEEKKRKIQISVPGILNPYEIPEKLQN